MSNKQRLELRWVGKQRGSGRPLASSAARHLAPVYGVAFPWPSNAGALTGGVAQALLPVTKADAVYTMDTGKSACATRPAAHDRPCTRVPKRSFPDLAPRRRAR